MSSGICRPLATIHIAQWPFRCHLRGLWGEAYLKRPKMRTYRFDAALKASRNRYGTALLLLWTNQRGFGRVEMLREVLDVEGPYIQAPVLELVDSKTGRPLIVSNRIEWGEPLEPHYTFKLGEAVFVGSSTARTEFLEKLSLRRKKT